MTTPKALSQSVNSWNAEYIEQQYRQFKEDPDTVSPDLQQFFQGFDLAQARSAAGTTNGLSPDARAAEDHRQAGVSTLIQQYRDNGHLCAQVDPFGRERATPASLFPEHHGLNEDDLSSTFDAGAISPDSDMLPLSDIIEILDETYCRTIGVEFMHMPVEEEREWLASRMEHTRNATSYDKGQRAHILYQLHRAELFEKFCAKRYPGVKRFSLEGGESLIPMLDDLVERSADEYDIKELVFAMSHRGRLNVLTNIIGKTYEQIFTEFDDSWQEDAEIQGGDVKYHRGFSANRTVASGKNIWLAMASNPSHLESAGGVAQGRTRAKQRLRGDTERNQVMPVILHGDAAMSGQGVVAECFNLSQLRGYTVGGSLHIVVNNLIGFTTGEEDARSSMYCTDVAKMIDAPIFHVNAEDPEACVHVMRLALDYRMRFQKDVVIDFTCYRATVTTRPTRRCSRSRSCTRRSRTSPRCSRRTPNGCWPRGDHGKRRRRDPQVSRRGPGQGVQEREADARGPDARSGREPVGGPLQRLFLRGPVNTTVPKEDLLDISRALASWPEDFKPHPKLTKVLKERATCVPEDKPLDWGTAETLAIGSILIQGTITRSPGRTADAGRSATATR